MSILSSPRRRRRLVRVGFVLGAAGVVALVIALLPTNGSNTTGVQAPPTTPFSTTRSPSRPERTTTAAVAAVRPLDDEFVNDLVAGRHLARAHSLLDAKLRARYALADWRIGRGLPISVTRGEAYRASNTLSFYGPTEIGFVSSVTPRFAADTGEPKLVAVRFAKTHGRWLVDYVHQGHASRVADQGNYSPPGFLPGSHRQRFWDWAIFGLIGVALIVVVVFLDRLLSRPPKSSPA